jgi:hypothetical protein
VVETSVIIVEDDEVAISPVHITVHTLSIEDTDEVDISPKLLPYVDLIKTKHLLMFSGSFGRIMKKEIGTVIDLVPIGIDVSDATAANMRFIDALGNKIDATCYVTALGLIRRIVDGTEMPVAGRYRVYPSIVSVRFSGNLEPFDILVIED